MPGRLTHYNGRWMTYDEKKRIQSNYFDEKRNYELGCPSYLKFQEHRSMIDGRWIDDRGFHRRHLKTHGVIEMGNEGNKGSGKSNATWGKGEVAKVVKDSLEQLNANGGYLVDKIRSGEYQENIVGTKDENGDVIEKPVIEEIDATGVKDGDYIRAEAKKD